MYQDILRHGERKDLGQKVLNAETKLAGRLRNLDGAIGGRSYPEPTDQPPTSVYWTALGTWGILKRRPDGTCLAKAQLHSAMARRYAIVNLFDDDGSPLEDLPDFFIRVPKAPNEWSNPNDVISFLMPPEERMFMRNQLLGVMKHSDANEPSLLSLLAEHVNELGTEKSQYPWNKAVTQYADPADRAALQRARMAAALSDVGRAVYAALVETLREVEDGIPTEDIHRSYLAEVLVRSRDEAQALNLAELNLDLPDLPPYLNDVLNQTLSWLANPRDLMVLWDVYAKAEEKRKGRRARLSRRLSGKERRTEWRPNDQSYASAIHYRWPKVLRLLRDLKGET